MESIQSSNSINIAVDIVWNKMEKWIHINAMQISAQLISSASFKIKHILLWYTKTKFMQDIDQVPDLKWRWKTLVMIDLGQVFWITAWAVNATKMLLFLHEIESW